jgi:hypothetical protein
MSSTPTQPRTGKRFAQTTSAVAALLLAACGGAPSESAALSSSPAPSTNLLAADQARVRALFDGHTQAFGQGLAGAATFMSAHQHPDTPFSADECFSTMRGFGFTDQYEYRVVPEVSAMVPDPGWALRSGRYAGVALSGRVYVVPVDVREIDPSIGLDHSYSDELHAALIDDTAYYFMTCEPEDGRPFDSPPSDAPTSREESTERGTDGNLSGAEIASLGQDICAAFDQGMSAGQVGTYFVNNGLTATEADGVVYLAVNAYCPEYLALVE